MRRLYGYNIVTEPSVKAVEHDTFQCAHCNDTVFVKPHDPSPWCSCCDQQWCGRPGCRTCTPFMKKVEAAEAAARSKMLLWRACDNV